MPEDPLDTSPAPVTPAASERKCVCEFCGCHLTPRGEIIRMGEVAKSVRKHDEVIEKKDKEVSRLSEELADAKRKIEELQPRVSSESSARRIGSKIQ